MRRHISTPLQMQIPVENPYWEHFLYLKLFITTSGGV
jgi:hypothetical protein